MSVPKYDTEYPNWNIFWYRYLLQIIGAHSSSGPSNEFHRSNQYFFAWLKISDSHDMKPLGVCAPKICTSYDPHIEIKPNMREILLNDL